MRNAKNTSAADMEKALLIFGWLILAGVLVATVVFTLDSQSTEPATSDTPIDQPSDPVTSDTLFTASATLMGFAVFGSALSTLGSNKEMIKGIAYMLIPLIVVQIIFMLSLLGTVDFSRTLWISVTGLLLMLLVLAMVANRIKSAGTGGTGS